MDAEDDIRKLTREVSKVAFVALALASDPNHPHGERYLRPL
jgi:hypothetical protein